MTSCRAVTWNLWWRFGDWQRRFEVIATELASVAPDVLGLQEVWARGSGPDSVNAAGLLAERLGMHWAWVPSSAPERWQRRIGDPSTAMGNAVLSRWPVAGVAHADLPGPSSGAPDGRRVLLAARDTPAGRLPFFTTQLSAFPGRSGLRCRHVREIASFVASHSPDELGAPAFVGPGVS